MKEIKDFIGEKYNRLTVIDFSYDEKRKRNVLKCLCDCGKITYAFPYQLIDGSKKSCGCYATEVLKEKNQNSMKNYNLRLYRKFTGIKRRCYNKNAKDYFRYGGRGITICKEWLENPFLFIKWAENNGGLDENLTIDRIDNDGPYSPDNCRFISVKTQNRNRRSNKILELNGERHCVSEWSEITGINNRTILSRIRKGWSISDTLTKKV